MLGTDTAGPASSFWPHCPLLSCGFDSLRKEPTLFLNPSVEGKGLLRQGFPDAAF